MANINDFISHFDAHQGFAKSSRFHAMIYQPNAMTGDFLDGENARGLEFHCESAELPGYNLNTIDSKVYGAPYAMAATPIYNELELTFLCGGDMFEKKFFDAWQSWIMPQQDYLVRYRSEYTSVIEVTQFSDLGIQDSYVLRDQTVNNMRPMSIYKVQFLEAFPSSVAAIPLNWADDNIARLKVIFKYRNWREMPSDKGLIANDGNLWHDKADVDRRTIFEPAIVHSPLT